MVEKFHDELRFVRAEVIKMGNLVKNMLKDSVQALKEQDIPLAESVFAKRTQLADMDYQLEKKTFRLIALYQPMAIDMREIACILKLLTYYTRVGRYSKDIAKITIEKFEDQAHVKRMVNIPRMASIVESMISDAIKAYESRDVSPFNDFIERETEVDDLRYSIYRECLSYMLEDPKKIKACTDYIIIARYLERCGDHACKMAEKIIYMVNGNRVEIDYREETSKTSFIPQEPVDDS